MRVTAARPPLLPAYIREAVRAVVLHGHADASTDFELIARATREAVGVSYRDLFASRSRAVAMVRGRELFVWLCRELTTLSYPGLAHLVGVRSHTTLVDAYQRAERRHRDDPKAREAMDQMAAVIRAARDALDLPDDEGRPR